MTDVQKTKSINNACDRERERDFIRKQAGARKADEEDGDGSTAHKGEHPTAHDPGHLRGYMYTRTCLQSGSPGFPGC